MSQRGPHVHTVTVRYLQSFHDPDHFAEPTDAYIDLKGAVDYFAERVNLPANRRLFP